MDGTVDPRKAMNKETIMDENMAADSGTSGRSGAPAADATALAQTWDPARYIANARFVAELGMPVVAMLEPVPGERILDLGCGDGFLTRKLADLGCVVTGVDASAAQVEAARGLGLDARVADAQRLGFDREFDAVFSNATLHWMRDPDAAIDGVRRALKPGGRFVGECGGEGCLARVVAALTRALTGRGLRFEDHNPWYFASAAEYRGRLEARGFRVERCEVFPRPTPLPKDLRAWLETFAENFLRAVPEAERDGFLDEVQEYARPDLQGPDGKWMADYTRLRFRAIRPV
jgi:SAM-dependent methyltransferase